MTKQDFIEMIENLPDDALEAIRDECAKCTSCMDCPFHLQVGSSVCCGIHYGSPAKNLWYLTIPLVL